LMYAAQPQVSRLILVESLRQITLPLLVPLR
jgi:hypothetical protein